MAFSWADLLCLLFSLFSFILPLNLYIHMHATQTNTLSMPMWTPTSWLVKRTSTEGTECFVQLKRILSLSDAYPPPVLSTQKPKELYDIIERFCLGRRRLELFGSDHNIRDGWITVVRIVFEKNSLRHTSLQYNSLILQGDQLPPTNYDRGAYTSHFREKGSYLLGHDDDVSTH